MSWGDVLATLWKESDVLGEVTVGEVTANDELANDVRVSYHSAVAENDGCCS